MSDEATTTNLATSLSLVQGDLPSILKTEKANTGSYGYTYASLADIHAAILPRLAAVGLIWVCAPTIRADSYVLVCSLIHAATGERIECEFPLPQNAHPQALGSAITYARRYSLCAIVGIAPDEDDDGAAAPAATVAAPQQQRPAPQDHRPRRQSRTTTAQPQDVARILDEALRQSDRAWHVKTWTTAPRSAVLPTDLLTEHHWRCLRAAGADMSQLRTLGDALKSVGQAVKSTGWCVADLVASPDSTVEEMDGAEAAAEGQ
jgi:hypothetical protein